jgi:hypothetical protein
MKRRTFIKNAIGTTILSLGGISAYQFYRQSLLESPDLEGFEYQFLNEHDLIVLNVLAPVLLGGEFKSASDHSQNESISSISETIRNVDAAIPLLSQSTQLELRELFDLLGSALGRVLIAQVWLDWQSASNKSIEQFLSNWRDSRLQLLQLAYRGLHKLVIGSFYAENKHWQSIGYPGPPAIGLN